MPSFQDLLCTITVRINHEEDFTFRKAKEELATRVRANHLPKIRELWGSKDATLSLDDDGDISVESYKGTLLITQTAVILTGWLLPLGWLSQGHNFPEIASVLDEAFSLRTFLRPTGYEIRLFLPLRFKEDLSHGRLLPSYFQAITSQLADGESSSSFNTLRWALEYQQDDFVQRWELRSLRQEFQVRYSASSSRSSSVSEFLAAVLPILAKSISKVEAVVAPFIEHPEKLMGLAFARAD